LKLILDNILPLISVGLDTYAKVISAWTNAMSGFESLLQGMPLQVSDSAILLALSAWHLYPNLIVLSAETKKADFKDNFVSPKCWNHCCIQWDEQGDSQGFRWFLALPHLKYYGDNSRETMRELQLVALGALLAGWGVPPAVPLDAATWLSTLRKVFKQAGQQWTVNEIFYYPWFDVICSGASALVNSAEDERRAFQMLVNFGRRRGRICLGDFNSPIDQPFFGLCNPHIRH
jgi:hypothetical protein